MIFPFALACPTISFRESRVAPRNGTLARCLGREESHKLILWLFLAIVFLAAIAFQNLEWALSRQLCRRAPGHPGCTTRRRRISAGVLTLAFLVAGLCMVIWIGPEPVIARLKHSAALCGSRARPLDNLKDTVN